MITVGLFHLGTILAPYYMNLLLFKGQNLEYLREYFEHAFTNRLNSGLLPVIVFLLINLLFDNGLKFNSRLLLTIIVMALTLFFAGLLGALLVDKSISNYSGLFAPNNPVNGEVLREVGRINAAMAFGLFGVYIILKKIYNRT